MSKDKDKLKEEAISELMKETKRAAARAEIGGSLAWSKPKQASINKRFLNKTLIGNVIQNNIVMKSDLAQKQNTAQMIKSSPSLKDKVEENPTIPKNKSQIKHIHSKKIVISNKSRLKAYIKNKANQTDESSKQDTSEKT